MKKKVVSKLLAVALAVSMLGGLMACGSSTTEAPAEAPAAEEEAPAEEAPAEEEAPAAEEEAPAAADAVVGGDPILQSFDERVELDVVAFVGSDEPDGRRTDPTSLWLEESLNIDLYLTHVTEADWPTQLSAMLADNDLPDIFLLSDVTKQLPMLTDAGSVLDYRPYLADYAPNTAIDPAAQLMFAANSASAYSPDGGLYLWGLCKGSWDDGTQPTCGHYIRWDLYKEAGYPTLEVFDTDMLDVMEAMVALEPETADGQKTYGMGSWFGNGQGWGEWFFIYGLAPQLGASVEETTGMVMSVNKADSTISEVNQLTDPTSYWWRAVQFANRANQRGLLDPDSFTQQSDVYEENLKAGKYMFNYPGWMSGNANNEWNKTEGNTKMLISIPATGSDYEDRFGNMYRGERQYVINANTEQPERCVALLDLVSTHWFSRFQYDGAEGVLWNMVDGVPVPTEEYLTAEKDAAYNLQYGRGVYHHFMGYGNGTKNPADGEVMDLSQYSKAAGEAKMNDTLADFISHFGQESWGDVYRAETPNPTPKSFLTLSAEGDVVSYINELSAYRGKNIFNCVAAASDAEFEAMRDEMINEFINTYHVNEIFDYFYEQAQGQADSVAELAALADQIK